MESKVCLELLCAETLSQGCLLNSWSCRSLVLTSPAMRYAVLFSQLYFIRSSNTYCSNGNNHTSHSTPPSVPEKVSKEVSKADMRCAQDCTVILIQPRVKLFKQLKKSVQICASGPLATLIAMLSLQTTQHCSQAAAR